MSSDKVTPTKKSDTPPPGLRGDQLLRWHGYEIHSRPNTGPNLWIRNGIIRTEEEALRICTSDPMGKP